MTGNGALIKYDAAFCIYPGCYKGGRHFPSMSSKSCGFLWCRHRMQVDDAINAFKTFLQPDPVFERAQIITEMQIPGRLYAGKYAFHVLSSRGALSGEQSLSSSLRLVKRAFIKKGAQIPFLERAKKKCKKNIVRKLMVVGS